MSLLDLVRQTATGRLSHTKLWANVGYGAATWAFVHEVVQRGLTPELLLVYTGVVAASATASKLLSLRYRAGLPDDEPGTTRIATRTETVASTVVPAPEPSP